MKIKAIYLYLSLALWTVLLLGLLKFTQFNTTGLGITLVTLTFLLVPGIFLWRLSKIEAESLAVKMLYVISFGFSFYFLINLLGIVLGLSLLQVIWIILILGLILLALACFFDFKKTWPLNFEGLKSYSFSDWFLILLALGGTVVGLASINAQIDKIIGDGMFHLALLQKVVSADNLNPHHLWVTKTTSLNLVYSFPIWHIFVGEISKILSINIFTAYTQILFPMAIITFMVVFAFLKIIFKERFFVLTLYLTFLVFLFSGIFYALIPLRAPDSFDRLLLLPLVLGLTVEYLFSKSDKIFPRALLVSGLAIFMGLIHFTQLVDYFLVLLVFLVLFLIISKDKLIIKKLGWLILTIGGLTLPYLLIFQGVNVYHFFLYNAAAYTGDNFVNKSYHDANIIYLYTVCSLPILAILIKSKRQLIFLISIPIALLLVSWQIFGLRTFFLKYLGEIFTIRAITDIPGFVFLGVIFLTIILILSLVLAKLPKLLQYLLYTFLAVLTLVSVIFFNNSLNIFVDETIFNPKNLFFYEFFEPIVVAIVAITLIFFILIHFYYKKELIITEPKNKFSFTFFTFLLFLILSLPYWPVFQKTITNSLNNSLLSDREIPYFGDVGRIGGQQTVTFLGNLPPESILAFSNVNVSQIALLYTKAYVFEYPYGVTDFTASKTIYDPTMTDEERLQFIKVNSIDYIVTLKSAESDLFVNSSHFQKVFENDYKYEVKTKKTSYQKEGDFIVFKYLP
ncbi:MAG: hypothetical protein M1429_00960 [Patescibacteria group bacterium]|nr:hypothetical protein [Patescibacteria group bacterium]